jgi:hypothetical protein
MNFETLRYYKAVADARSISKAAQSLTISQQGLNKSLTALEHEVGCTLMTRTRQGVEITESGRLFLQHAEVLLREYCDMLFGLNVFKHDVELLQGTEMQVLVSPACMHSIMTPMIERFNLYHLKLTEVVTEEALKGSGQDNTLILADIFSPFYPDETFGRRYSLLPLVNARYGIVSAKTALQYTPKSVSRTYVAKLPLGLFSNETTKAMYEHVLGSSVHENILLTTTSHNTLFDNMLVGRLAILVDSFQFKQMAHRHSQWSNQVVFSEIEGDYDILFAFVFDKGHPPTGAQKSWAESFVKAFHFAI